MERVIRSDIRQHLDDHNILSPFQHGFRKKHSCETQLLLTTNDITKLHDQNLQVDIAILDFSKAFDVVPHNRLLNKLNYFGINGNVQNWIKSFLMGRTQRVLVKGEFSDDEEVASGVPQGTVMGPLLFLLYCNHLPGVISPGTRVRLFADDCLIYRPVQSLRDQLILQQDLDSLVKWRVD